MTRVMEGINKRGRFFFAAGFVVTWMLLAWCPSVFALNPALDINQYAHMSWKIRDGFPKGEVRSIAQTPDGYLWLGTEFGLQRFDGVRSVMWQPPADQHLPSDFIWSLLVTRDGTLWIGTSKGLASWKDGKLTEYPELAGQYIFKLIEDREGTVWVGTLGIPTGRLCAIWDGSIQCFGEDGSLGRAIVGLYEDSRGNLWAGAENGLWRWKPGSPIHYSLEEPDGIQGLGEDVDGALLIGWHGGIVRFVDGKTEALSGVARGFYASRLLRDRDGGLWIGTYGRGLMHQHQGRTDLFTQSDGLSSEGVDALFEDREGNIWVATPDGLDRFRDFAVATFAVKQGLSNDVVRSVLTDRDGSVWLSNDGGLTLWKNGQITIPLTGGGKPDGKLNGHSPNSLFQDDRGRIWVASLGGIGYLENDRFVPVTSVPAGNVLAIVQDTAGSLWIANETLGLLISLRGMEVQRIPWAALGHKDHISSMAADPVRGGIWAGFFLGGIAYLSDGQVRASYSAADGLGEGHINQLRADQDGTLWAATEGGLSRLKNGRIATLSSKNGLLCDGVHWSIEDDEYSHWLYTACGLLRIARGEMDAWSAAADQDKDRRWKIHATVFDTSDGVRLLISAGHYSPQVSRSSDGRLWFTSMDGVSVIDPRHLSFNSLPPPVHVETITADRKTYDASDTSGRLRLPALIRDVVIDYTALSLVAPEKILFRYKLEGYDSEWQEAGNRRQAFYTNLPPRNYRFRVIACNNSGVWNEAGTFLDFSIAPAYYQTTWFKLSCVATFLILLVVLYQLRVRQVARRFNMRLEARVDERTRIARDLHDTLLQSFQGVLLKFYSVTFMLPDRPAEAHKALETAIDQAEQAITDGRDAIQGLRSSTLASNELSEALIRLGGELATNHAGPKRPNFSVDVEGSPQILAPLIRDEIQRIAGEALRNAFRHSQASRIEVEILYGRRQLRLRVRDNGKGIEQKVADEGGRAGHYGMAGMRERAELVGGDLAVWSERNLGTEIELTIPASIAYAKPAVARRAMFFGKRSSIQNPPDDDQE